jgi:pilus assembly protein Flp/PilA
MSDRTGNVPPVARLLRNFAVDERGTTAIEYGLLAGLISLVIISTVFTLGNDIKVVLYDKIATALSGG